ncbi:hypothetical protein ABVB69_22275, partial [Streptomyces sp. NPDC000349]|uniref:hypothetical protein n=1 Tax=Streptomyces sp. NPDC000349 TaxID=3154249 RepID=UPI003369C61E
MAAQEPPPPADGAAPVLAALVARMRDAGIGPGVEELADALWLARWLPGPARPQAPGAPVAGRRAGDPPGGPGAAAPPPAPRRPPPRDGGADGAAASSAAA